MLLNEQTAVVGQRVVLVPYRDEHVPRYHDWMSDPALRELTASEELSLDEEHEMCTSWRVDADKLTFIVLERDLTVDVDDPVRFRAAHGVERMIGDVNLFLSPRSPSPSASSRPRSAASTRAELELMIASAPHRGRGLGKDALRLFMSYARPALGLRMHDFFVKVGMSNVSSLGLFKGIGFEEFKVVDVFQEVELRWPGSSDDDDERWPWERTGSSAGSTVFWPTTRPRNGR